MPTITQEFIPDGVTFSDDGRISVKQIVVTLEDGIEVSRNNTRSTYAPGEDVSNAPSYVQSVANVAWTPAVIQEFLDAASAATTEIVEDLQVLLDREIDARIADASDKITRNYLIKGLPVPVTWTTYVTSLEALSASATPAYDANNQLDLTSVVWPAEPAL